MQGEKVETWFVQQAGNILEIKIFFTTFLLTKRSKIPTGKMRYVDVPFTGKTLNIVVSMNWCTTPAPLHYLFAASKMFSCFRFCTFIFVEAATQRCS